MEGDTMAEIANNRQIAIKVSNVKKMYKLGQIGGGTLQADLQSWWAKKRGKEDPNSIIGEGERSRGDTFMALNGVDLTIYQGEAVGIIGSNGAGKSTLLKLLSRVTAPTEGEIDIYGRIVSMLEVGTGFNGELTGRENVYMNGAILGMTKSEIDEKMEEIIEFSEVREFIDTPVKRYSSGMFVKLAFSVAAHLDAEIMIMDEVLAVGDMTFQTKCLNKMREAANRDGRTVLYVSHNMNTIRKLCDRCIVLDKGKMIYEGEVEKAIEVYLGANNTSNPSVELASLPREKYFSDGPAKMTKLEIDTETSTFVFGAKIKGSLLVSSTADFSHVNISFVIINSGVPVMTSETGTIIHLEKRMDNRILFEIDLDKLVPSKYSLKIIISQKNNSGGIFYLDVLMDSYAFEVIPSENFYNNRKWNIDYTGYFLGNPIRLLVE